MGVLKEILTTRDLSRSISNTSQFIGPEIREGFGGIVKGFVLRSRSSPERIKVRGNEEIRSFPRGGGPMGRSTRGKNLVSERGEWCHGGYSPCTRRSFTLFTCCKLHLMFP